MAATIAFGNPAVKSQAAAKSQEAINSYEATRILTLSAQGSEFIGACTSASGSIFFHISSLSGKVGILVKDAKENGKVVAAASHIDSSGNCPITVPKNKLLYIFIQNEETKEVSLTLSWNV